MMNKASMPNQTFVTMFGNGNETNSKAKYYFDKANSVTTMLTEAEAKLLVESKGKSVMLKTSPKELPQEMPRVPRRITTCNGCGSLLQTTVFYCDLCGDVFCRQCVININLGEM
eukprot:11203481-Karenia_brevis.AAC.1